MTNLITEARELCERANDIRHMLKNRRNTQTWKMSSNEALELEFAIDLIPELCDALENAQEQNKQLMHEVCKLACESLEREKTFARLEAEVEARLEERHEVD